jgi:hypothetical protein
MEAHACTNTHTHKQVANELGVIYARTLDLSRGEYTYLYHAMVKLGWRITTGALRHVQNNPIAAAFAAGEFNGDYGEEWNDQGEEKHPSKEAGAVEARDLRHGRVEEDTGHGGHHRVCPPALLGLFLNAGTDAVEAEEEQGSCDWVGRRGLSDFKTRRFVCPISASICACGGTGDDVGR